MQPQEVYYLTELDSIYAKELKNVINAEEFEAFIHKWNYWLDDDCKTLSAKDWDELYPKIKECRKPDIEPNKEHEMAAKILLPEKLLFVSMIAEQFKVPWGCAYIRAKEEKVIDY